MRERIGQHITPHTYPYSHCSSAAFPNGLSADDRALIKDTLQTLHNTLYTRSPHTQFKHPPTHGLCLLAFAHLLSPHLANPPPCSFNYHGVYASLVRAGTLTKGISFLRHHVLPTLSLDENPEPYLNTIGSIVHEYSHQCMVINEFPLSTGRWVIDRSYELEMELMHNAKTEEVRLRRERRLLEQATRLRVRVRLGPTPRLRVVNPNQS